MLTAGAHIASMVTVEAATTAAAAGRPSTVIMLTATMIVATAGRTADLMAAKHTVDPTAGRMAVESMVDLTAAGRMAVERLMVAEHTVAEHRTVAADIPPAGITKQ